jgi:hypothetical protein
MKIVGGPFKGAKVFLNPAHSKRKIFGLYEHVLNSWILKSIKDKQFVFDVGANTGYDTYGFAFLLKKQATKNPLILAFEPEEFVELEQPQHWEEYKGIDIKIISKYVGAEESDTTTTLDNMWEKYKNQANGAGLIKIDIEGDEVNALKGATNLLKDLRHDWLIEIHGDELIPRVASFFVDMNRPFLIKELTDLPIIGKETRSIKTTWLVTI